MPSRITAYSFQVKFCKKKAFCRQSEDAFRFYESPEIVHLPFGQLLGNFLQHVCQQKLETGEETHMAS